MREMLAQDMLARPALRCAAGEHRGEPAHDLALLGVGRPPFLIADPKFLERAPGTVETRAELFGAELALRGGVSQTPQLRRLNIERSMNVALRATTPPR